MDIYIRYWTRVNRKLTKYGGSGAEVPISDANATRIATIWPCHDRIQFQYILETFSKSFVLQVQVTNGHIVYGITLQFYTLWNFVSVDKHSTSYTPVTTSLLRQSMFKCMVHSDRTRLDTFLNFAILPRQCIRKLYSLLPWISYDTSYILYSNKITWPSKFLFWKE